MKFYQKINTVRGQNFQQYNKTPCGKINIFLHRSSDVGLVPFIQYITLSIHQLRLNLHDECIEFIIILNVVHAE